jgi:TPR repeat protein/energy-coupling factor transporter ATP-binding protein EcfA2
MAERLNPFPGLRPFEFDENYLFFGRDGQTDKLLLRLRRHRFLAVLGTSGSGKSSLVRAGLLPDIHGGLMVAAGSSWRVALFKPGNDPIGNLAQALSEPETFASTKDGGATKPIIESTLRRSALGLIEVVRQERAGGNLLIVADQFEEIFRFPQESTARHPDDEAAAFVKLLLEAAHQSDYPIYVVLTMRSDYLGDCARFAGLPEAINEGLYLVPRMTRDELREAITSPVAVGRGEIAPRLVNRLLNDVGDNPDQLPILQHALMRTWDFWAANHSDTEPIDLRHYEAIGGMSKAMSLQADEAYDELSEERGRFIAKNIFKALTDFGTDPHGIRRPRKLATLSEIVGTGSEEEVKAVIEVFREPSRSFLMPPAPAPLEPEKVIDISHESLMRVWERLRNWAEEEANSARWYRRLAEAAAREKMGKTRLWRDPDLQLALDWQEEQAPTPAWANLYGGDFKLTTAFLERSRAERDHKRAQVVFERYWSYIRLVIILVIAGFFVWGLQGGGLQGGHFDRWSNTLGWSDFVKNELSAKAPPPQAGSSPLTREVQKGVEEVRASNAASGLLVLMPFLALCLLGYFVLAYFGEWVFRRFAFAKILHEVALSSSKAVREQKLAEQAQALRDAVATLQMTYASFWRRLGAYGLDLGLFMVGLVTFLAGLVYAIEFLQPLLGSGFVGLLLIPFVVGWFYQAMMLSSRRQATLGMLALGIFVTNQNGYRLNFGRATARYFAKVLSYITLGIGFFIQPFTRKHQTLHDLIVRSVVRVRSDKRRVRWWIVVLCVIGLMLAWLASLLGLGFIVLSKPAVQATRGWAYENGQGVPKDLTKGAELYQKAADQGDTTAQTRLGWLYERGQGVPKDLGKAAELLRKAAELDQKAADQGYAPAQFSLGWSYQNGQGVPKDLGKAAELYQKAADQGDAAALGWLYQNGQSVPKDFGKAAELYQKAADQGRTLAQNNLGWLYENGQGVPKDLAKAGELYQKAANHGYEPAIANLERLSGH